jgi:hypothetical protein
MNRRLTGRIGLLLVILLLSAQTIPAQVTTSGRLSGEVKDSQGALIPKAQIVAKHDQTQTEYKTTANDEGGWTIPSIPNGTYTITITASGFKTTVTKDVKVDTGQATTLNSALETGGASEQVVVTGGAEVLQRESATVATTIVGRQIGELPFSTRDALTLITTLPGVSSPGVPRASTVNGLPKGSVNLTLDGANIQDNFLRSSDGFFTTIQAKSDAVQEVTVSTAVPGAESGGEGAVQVRFTTKSGSPEFHGGGFWQYRSKTFNSNYYFNNIDGLPRDAFILRQFGGNLGGPIFIPKLMKSRDKAFFFVNYEYFTLPQAYGNDVTGNTLVLTPDARKGLFTYPDTTGALRQVDLLPFIASKCPAGTPCPTSIDPRVAAGLNLVDGYVHSAGSLTSRIATQSPGDYNRLDYNFQDPGQNIRWFPTVRFDYNLNAKHHLEFIHNYQHYFSNPDGVNGQLDVYPGSGIVVGSPGTTGSIHRNSFSFVGAHRWTINDRLINEIRATSSGNGTSLFTQEFAPGLYDFWGGFAVNAGTYLGPQSLGTGPFYTRRSQSRRNTPVKGLSDNLNMLKGAHTINFGFAFTRVASFTQAVDTQVVPQMVFGVDATDPIVNVFSAANFPGSSSTQRTQAQQLYALLTGRVSAINRSASLNEATRSYDFIPFTERNHQNEFAYYAQDTWKAMPNLTFSYGVRWEIDPSPFNDNLIYTRTGVEGVYGVSGNGNIFKSNVIQNTPTFFRLLTENEKGYRTRHKDFAPTFGFAWSPNFKSGILHTIFGSGDQTVFRGGYGIAYTREGFNAYTSMFGSNNGPTINLNVTPSTTPSIFKAGSVLYRDPSTYPFVAPPADTSRFPLLAGGSASVNDFDPDLKPGYTQSYSFGLQREIDKNTAVEVRYVGTHGTHLWRQYNLNEVNIFENGFLDVFKAAAKNLEISRAAGRGDNYGNQNLPGQVNVPLITTAIGGSAAATNTTVVTQLQQGQAGALASSIATSAGRMNNLINAGLVPFVTLPDGTKVSNFFIVNPQAATGGAFIMTNGVDTQFHALQIEVRRRLSNGLLVQGSYQYGKALSNSYGSSSAVATQPRTLRDLNQDWGLSPWDLRHSFKLDWLYELPIGPGRAFLNGHVPVVSKVLEGWQFGGVARIQTGPVFLMTSGRATFNQNDSGVVLHNISTKQLQDLVKIRKETVCSAGTCRGVVFWLPDSIIQNSLAAFDLGKGLASLDPNAPYIGPQTEPGKLGDRVFLHGPMTARWDLNLVKRTRITERVNFEARMQLLNAFNRPNFYILSATADARTAAVNSSSFGQTRAAYRDFTVSGTNDPGGRLIEFQFRLNF